MKVRRIIVGTGKNGNGEIVSDIASVQGTTLDALPGFESALFWSTSAQAIVATGEPQRSEMTVGSIPSVGETRLNIVSIPPESTMANAAFDGAAFGEELLKKMPEFASTFEVNEPGMHRTESIDYAIILEGELVLELGNGQKIQLHEHDVVVQHGNKHAWRNMSNNTAQILFVLIGARRC
ncbi:cupin domain-containing protein [Pseudomonas sp. W5-36]|uniref:cupin domain-containing protein n=1 Tax=Pseudomonas sp. W5-36 TaxID=3097455 RepID=UPI00397AAC0B